MDIGQGIDNQGTQQARVELREVGTNTCQNAQKNWLEKVF